MVYRILMGILKPMAKQRTTRSVMNCAIHQPPIGAEDMHGEKEPNMAKPFDNTDAIPSRDGKILQPRYKHLISPRYWSSNFAYSPPNSREQQRRTVGCTVFIWLSTKLRASSPDSPWTSSPWRWRISCDLYPSLACPCLLHPLATSWLVGLSAWISVNLPSVAWSNGLNPFWAGAFDANMTAFQTADYMLITMALMILAGNTAYPVFLPLIVWALWMAWAGWSVKVSPASS